MKFMGLIAPVESSVASVHGTNSALQRVANRPIVCHVLEALQRGGIAEVVLLAAASDTEDLRACITAEGPEQLAVDYVPYAEGSFGRGLRAASHVLGDSPLVAHAADGLLVQPLAPLTELLEGGTHDLLALVHRQPATNGSVALATRRVLRLAGASHEENALELAGVGLLGAGALGDALQARGWRNPELDLVTIAERLASLGRRVGVQHIGGWRRNRGKVEDLLELNRIAFDTIPRDQPPPLAAELSARDAESRLEGYVEVHPTARLHASVVVGPARIGPGAEVTDSYIGPYTSIGAGARIESAEVERSIIMPGASIMHIGGRLVGSVVGREARIFRDFSLPRALRVNVGDGNEVALC
jgi:glucose-1-phosphate thymidylyltransferase